MRWLSIPLFLVASPALAQMSMTGAGSTGYFGAGNQVPSAIAWWGTRGYNSVYSGKAINVCNVADAACADMNISNGNLVITTIGGSNCSVVTCTIKTVYDQIGTNHLTQAAIINRLDLVISATGGRACMAGKGGTQLVGPTAIVQASPITYSLVAKRTGSFTTFQTVIGDATGAPQIGFANSASTFFNYNGNVGTATAADSTFHAVQAVVNGASSSLYIDGTSTTLDAGVGNGGLTDVPEIGASNIFLTGNICEVGVWAGAFTAAQQAAMNSNQRNYWGF